MADRYGRTGGPFLDQLEAEAREKKSAEIEGREPDFSRENLFPLDFPLVVSEPENTVVDEQAAESLSPGPEVDGDESEVDSAVPVEVETASETSNSVFGAN